jgi:adenylate kinase family enzyme
MIDQHKLLTLFSSSYVLGGSPCSGKSTLAERLSHENQLPYYKVDDHLWRHLEQSDPESQPTMAAYAAMSWDQIWSQPVESQVADVFAYYTEQFPMVLADLLAYCDQSPIVMEGAAFLPDLIFEWGVRADHAFFLVPSKAFQVENYAQRTWVQPILDSCRNPDQSFANWMERDHRFGLEIFQRAENLGYRTAWVDGSTSIDDIHSSVLTHFQMDSICR